MITKSCEVKTGKPQKVVGTIDYPVYESIAEAVEAEGEQTVLQLFNQKNKVRLQGLERAKHTPGRAGKNKLREAAYNLLTTEELARFAQDFSKLQTYLDSPEMVARAKASLGISEDEEELIAQEG